MLNIAIFYTRGWLLLFFQIIHIKLKLWFFIPPILKRMSLNSDIMKNSKFNSQNILFYSQIFLFISQLILMFSLLNKSL
jgi:hypothetical protein